MKTKMSKVFSVACLLLLSVAGVQAQNWKYPRVDGGNTIVSRDAAGGINSAALLNDAEKYYLNNTNSTTNTYSINSPYNKVSARFQVASTSASTGTTWANAHTLCQNYATDGNIGSWRLPTQRELLLIWVFRFKLTGCALTGTSVVYYWSSTSTSDSQKAYDVIFPVGTTNFVANDYTYTVRCVRDL